MKRTTRLVLLTVLLTCLLLCGLTVLVLAASQALHWVVGGILVSAVVLGVVTLVYEAVDEWLQ